MWQALARGVGVLSLLCTAAVTVIAAAAYAGATEAHPELPAIGAGFAAIFTLLYFAGRRADRWARPRLLLYLYAVTNAMALATLAGIAGQQALASTAVTVLLMAGFCLGITKPLADDVALCALLVVAHLAGSIAGDGLMGLTPSGVVVPLLAGTLFVYLGTKQFDAYRQRVATIRKAEEALRNQKQLEQSIRHRAHGLEAHVQRRQRQIDQLQEHLIQNEKLASIGELASCIAHELNNPLTVALGFTEEAIAVVEQGTDDREDLLESLGFVRSSVDRMTKIVSNLRTFSRRAPSNLQSVQVNETVEGAMLFLKRRFTSSGVEPVAELASDLPTIEGDPSALQQVLINLVGNACDALAEHPPAEGAPRVLVTTRVVHDDEVEIAVTDNGPGIPDSMKAAIFASFFTTKPAGVGTGLGLAICTEIVRRHRGRIGVADAPSGGARFVVRLPRTHATAQQGDGHAVLLLEPDAKQGRELARRLAERGCRPLVATSGAEAKAMLSDTSVSLLLTELRVPDARPISTFLAEVRNNRPDVRVVIVTAPPQNVRIHEILRVTAADGFYGKPMEDDDLTELLERFLMGSGAPKGTPKRPLRLVGTG
jgi:two-component system NtrC family sensor kinase